mmetsp:Transcript_47995/g.112842  ORF Transcript_47995/g.112842 Transcript_47995/m.112842 type:complete len:208 (+) Transcript_47995:474-1097(+)
MIPLATTGSLVRTPPTRRSSPLSSESFFSFLTTGFFLGFLSVSTSMASASTVCHADVLALSSSCPPTTTSSTAISSAPPVATRAAAAAAAAAAARFFSSVPRRPRQNSVVDVKVKSPGLASAMSTSPSLPHSPPSSVGSSFTSCLIRVTASDTACPDTSLVFTLARRARARAAASSASSSSASMPPSPPPPARMFRDSSVALWRARL